MQKFIQCLTTLKKFVDSLRRRKWYAFIPPTSEVEAFIQGSHFAGRTFRNAVNQRTMLVV